MSLEAITWALNLAPIPMDVSKNGTAKPNPACAGVLVGLANHADPDGTAAFPSVRRLMIYTRLSERTVRTALDRLEAEGITTPCSPEAIAAKIKRADRRPKGWDLSMDLLRTDLTAEDVELLDRQFPWLRAALQTARDQAKSNGVQPLHPVGGQGMDGVKPLHPVGPDGVQPPQERGATTAPEPSYEPPKEQPPPPGLRPGGAPPTQPAADGAGTDQGTATRKRGRSKGAAAHPLPDGWTPSPEKWAAAVDAYPGLDLRFQTANFVDTHRGKGSEWKNWDLAWQRWMREEYAKLGEHPPVPSEVGNAAERLAEWWWQQCTARGPVVEGSQAKLTATLTQALAAMAQTMALARAKPLLRQALVQTGMPCPRDFHLQRALNPGATTPGGPGRTDQIMRDARAEAARLDAQGVPQDFFAAVTGAPPGDNGDGPPPGRIMQGSVVQ